MLFANWYQLTPSCTTTIAQFSHAGCQVVPAHTVVLPTLVQFSDAFCQAHTIILPTKTQFTHAICRLYQLTSLFSLPWHSLAMIFSFCLMVPANAVMRQTVVQFRHAGFVLPVDSSPHHYASYRGAVKPCCLPDVTRSHHHVCQVVNVSI